MDKAFYFLGGGLPENPSCLMLLKPQPLTAMRFELSHLCIFSIYKVFIESKQVQAAMGIGGHLVLSTHHTDDEWVLILSFLDTASFSY